MPALSAGSLEPSGWSVQFAVAGILQSEGIGDAVEEGEEGGDVDGFGDLRVAVSGFSESDHLLVGGCGRFECQRFDELEQQFLFGVDLSADSSCSTTELSSSCNCRKWACASVQYWQLLRAET